MSSKKPTLEIPHNISLLDRDTIAFKERHAISSSTFYSSKRIAILQHPYSHRKREGGFPMTRSQQPALALFSAGMIGLGMLALVYGGFALVSPPVAPWFPARTFLAYCSGVLMLLAGVGLLFRTTAAWSARILFPYLVVWLLLKVP